MAGTVQLLFRSVTWAARAQKLLLRYGMSSDIKRVTNSGSLGGCGYALEVDGDKGQAMNLLRQANIQVVSVLY